MNRTTISCENPKTGSREGVGPLQALNSFLHLARRRECLLLLIGLGWVGGAFAVTAGDPTEPPAAWLAAQPPVSGVTVGTVTALPKTQMIVNGKSRKFAVIDGDIVKVGDKYKDSKVVAIKDDKVVMEDASKSLRVTPDVEKKAPVVSKIKKKSVVIPEGSVPAKAQ